MRAHDFGKPAAPSRMKKINVGIIGYGWVAGAHLEAINATGLGQVTAICSARGLNEEELKARHGSDLKCCSRVEELLADRDINVVSICSYPKLHPQQIIAAARAGKHLIIEKPLALSLKDLRAVQAAVKKAA
jgi:predicted dehydrogenase